MGSSAKSPLDEVLREVASAQSDSKVIRLLANALRAGGDDDAVKAPDVTPNVRIFLQDPDGDEIGYTDGMRDRIFNVDDREIYLGQTLESLINDGELKLIHAMFVADGQDAALPRLRIDVAADSIRFDAPPASPAVEGHAEPSPPVVAGRVVSATGGGASGADLTRPGELTVSSLGDEEDKAVVCPEIAADPSDDGL